MAQQNKPHRRTAREAGYGTSSTRYSVPGEKKRKPIVPILIAAALVVAGVGFFASGLNGNPDEQQQQTQQTQPAQQPADQDQNKAGTNGNDAKSDKDASAKRAGSSKDTSSGDAKGSDGSSSSSDAAKDGSSSSDGTASSKSSRSSDTDGTTGTAQYAEQQASVVQGEEDDANWQGGDNGSYAPSSGGSDSEGDGASSSSLYSDEKGYSKLKKYRSTLGSQSDKLSTFVDDVYNSHLYSKLSVRKKDYQDFLKLKSQLISALGEAEGVWDVDDFEVSSNLRKTKSNLSKASDLLVKRINIIENGYKAINALGKNASKSKIQKANDAACADSASTYAKYESVMADVVAAIG